jgi:probable addiction module antidote protein
MSPKIDPNAARRLGVRGFDATEYLRDDADIAAYLEAAAAEEDPRVLAAALSDIARARAMAELAPKRD